MSERNQNSLHPAIGLPESSCSRVLRRAIYAFQPCWLLFPPDAVSWGGVHNIQTVEHQTWPRGCRRSLQDQPGPPWSVLLGPVPHALANGISVSSCMSNNPVPWPSVWRSLRCAVWYQLKQHLCVLFQAGNRADASTGRWKHLLRRHALQRHLGSNGEPCGQRSGQSYRTVQLQRQADWWHHKSSQTQACCQPGRIK